MRTVDKEKLAFEECLNVQLNGLNYCKNCKFTGITACMGKNIVKTGKNAKGYSVGEKGLAYEYFEK